MGGSPSGLSILSHLICLEGWGVGLLELHVPNSCSDLNQSIQGPGQMGRVCLNTK